MTKQFKVLLIGDSCIDEYHYGVCERLSPEAPVPVLKVTRSETKTGMAANVKDNLEAFDVDVDFMTGGVKCIKKRYIDERSGQHIVRVDEDSPSVPFDPYLNSLQFGQYSAIVISDYNKGFITYENIAAVREQYFGPIFIDTKKPDLSKFEGMYVKINQLEYDNSWSTTGLLITTLGEQGARFKDKLYPAPKVDVVDVCGAGDTFLAALVYKYLSTKTIETAIPFANKASAVAVTHSGVYALNAADIEEISK